MRIFVFLKNNNKMSMNKFARRHIGIYAYKVDCLNQFIEWDRAPLEILESLEQLRFLYNNIAIHIADAVAAVPGGIDTEDDLKSLINLL